MTKHHLRKLAPYRTALRERFEGWTRQRKEPLWTCGIVTDAFYVVTLGVGKSAYDAAAVREKVKDAPMPAMIFDGKMVHVVKASGDEWTAEAAEEDAKEIASVIIAEEMEQARRRR